eukprot:1178317-Prorocentrum_minimum.AAC.6
MTQTVNQRLPETLPSRHPRSRSIPVSRLGTVAQGVRCRPETCSIPPDKNLVCATEIEREVRERWREKCSKKAK